MKRWSAAVIDEDLSTSIKKKVDEIFCFIANTNRRTTEYSLMGGTAGVALFLFMYYKYSNREESYELALDILENSIKNASKDDRNGSFCNGLAGLGWLIEFLSRENFIDVNTDDILNEADLKIDSFFNEKISERNYDFLHGGVGCGVYFLNRKSDKSRIIEKYVRKIREISIKTDIGMFWIYHDPLDSSVKHQNLGLSHGIPSLISFLSDVYNKGILKSECAEMINEAVKYVMSCRQDYKTVGSFFPHFVDDNQIITQSRLAWCYGDLGVGITLLKASIVLQSKSLQSFALDIFKFHSTNFNLEKYFVRDAGVCHGTAGIALIFQRLYNHNGDVSFKNASNFWLKQTLEFSNFDEGAAGFKMYDAMSASYRNNINLLEGISGIGLSLISSISEIEPTWDNSLLIT